MTEIERFKKALNAAYDRLELENYSDCSSELFSASNAILTTIESQKEEIERLNLYKELSELQDRLLACYRVGRNPGQWIDKLSKLRAKIQEGAI